MSTYEEDYKRAVERQKQGVYNGYSPAEIDRQYGKTAAPTYAQKIASLASGHDYEKNKIINGWYDNADNRKMSSTDDLRNYYIYKETGNLDHIGKYDPKYDDLQAYYGKNRSDFTPAQWDDFIAGKTKVDYGQKEPEITFSGGGGGSRNSFTPTQRQALSYGEASERAKQQLDPLYERAIENMRKQRYQNELNASEVASKRGLAHSGLAADQMNKIGIATQSNISDLDAQRAAKIAEMAQRMVEFDQNMTLQERSQALNEYLGVEGLNLNREQFDFGKYTNQRDFDYNKSIDSRNFDYQKALLDYQKAQDERNFGYQQQRDARRDAEWESVQKDERAWRKYAYENMSAAQKAQFEYNRYVFDEEMAWREYEMNHKSEVEKAMNEALIKYYQNADFNTEVKGDGWIPNTKDYKITSTYGGRADPFTGNSDNHRGIDLAVPKNTPLASTVSGKVVSTSGHSSYGNTVVIQDANGFLHRYAHLESVNVKVGQEVLRGSFIGKSGNSGRSTGAHLHYEVTNSKGGLVDPSRFLQ